MEGTEAESHGGNTFSRDAASRKRRLINMTGHVNDLLACVDQTPVLNDVSTPATSS